MGTAPAGSLILTMALPIVLSTIVQSLYNIVDGIFVSQISEAAMTAITFTQPITIVLLAVGMGISVAMNTMLSHSLGGKDKKGVDAAAQTAIFLTVIASMISFIASFIVVRPFMLTQTTEPELGIRGAAIATVFSQIAALFIALTLNLKKNQEATVRFILKPPAHAIRQMLFLGVPTTILLTFNAFMMLGLNSILKGFSTTAVAVMGACGRITTLFYNLINALANTLTPVIAYNHGAGKKNRIIRSMKYGYLYGLILTAAGSGICIGFAREILLMFNATEEMMGIGVPAMRLMSVGYMLLAIRNTSTAVMQALGHSVQSIAAELCRNYLFLLPLAWLFSRMGIVVRVFWSYPVADAAAAVISGIMVLLLQGYQADERSRNENGEKQPSRGSCPVDRLFRSGR